MPWKYLLNVPLALFALTAGVSADERVDAAIRALDALAANSGQLQQYCEIVPAGGDVDAVRAEEISVALDKFWASFSDYEALIGLEGEFPDNSKEVADLEAAFNELEKKCKRD